MKILQAAPVHYAGYAAVINSLYPDNQVSVSEIVEDDKKRDPKFKAQRWVAIEKE